MRHVSWVSSKNMKKFKTHIRETRERCKLGFIGNSGGNPEGQNADAKEDIKDYIISLIYEFQM